MNPYFWLFNAEDRATAPMELYHEPVENPATASDRAYLAAHPELLEMALNTYDRPPIAGEWTSSLPQNAFVRVFFINEWTSVRVLHSESQQRISEPMLDSWRHLVEPYDTIEQLVDVRAA